MRPLLIGSGEPANALPMVTAIPANPLNAPAITSVAAARNIPAERARAGAHAGERGHRDREQHAEFEQPDNHAQHRYLAK